MLFLLHKNYDFVHPRTLSAFLILDLCMLRILRLYWHFLILDKNSVLGQLGKNILVL